MLLLGPVFTVMPLLVPVSELVTLSVAVTVFEPAVVKLNAFVNVWTPLSSAVKV